MSDINVNPERVNPDVVGAADHAAFAMRRIVSRITLHGGALNPLQRQSDAKELRLIAEAATNLAKALA